MLVKCDQCGKEVNKSPYRTKGYKHHFCCKKCYGAWLSQNTKQMITVFCLQCGVEVHRHPSDLKKYPRAYCSIKCHSLARRLGKMVRCCICGKEVYRRKSELRGKPMQNCCSPKCLGELVGTANRLKKLGNFSTRKDAHVLLAKVKSMTHQEAQTTIKETPR